MTKARDIASAIPAPSTVSSAELGFLDGVTSAIQTQVDAQIAKTLTTTTGDIIYASGANTPARLAVGSTSDVLTVAGGVPTWAAPAAGGGMTLINTGGTALTGASVVISSIPATYKHLMVLVKGLYCATANGSVYMRCNGDTGTNYAYNNLRNIGTTILGQTTFSAANFEPFPRTTATNSAKNLSNGTIWFMNYTDTDQISTTYQTYGTETTNVGVSSQGAGLYDNSAAITSITFYGDYDLSGGTAYVYGVN